MAVSTTVFDQQTDTNTLVSQSTVPSFASNIWRGSWVDVTAYRRVTGSLYMNQAALVNGVVVEFTNNASPTAGSDGDDEVDWWEEASTENRTNTVTAQSGHYVAWSYENVWRYARLVVKHNGTEPTLFRAYLVGVGIT